MNKISFTRKKINIKVLRRKNKDATSFKNKNHPAKSSTNRKSGRNELQEQNQFHEEKQVSRKKIST